MEDHDIPMQPPLLPHDKAAASESKLDRKLDHFLEQGTGLSQDPSEPQRNKSPGQTESR